MWHVRCRNSSCRHRRIAEVHPDEYKRTVPCPVCGETKGWRVENKYKDNRALCYCSGPVSSNGDRGFPHRHHHPLCDNHPHGPYNQAKRRDVDDRDIPEEFLPEHVKQRLAEEDADPDFCPF